MALASATDRIDIPKPRDVSDAAKPAGNNGFTEAWKVAVGLARLKKGDQAKALGMGSHGMKDGEVKGLLSRLGWA